MAKDHLLLPLEPLIPLTFRQRLNMSNKLKSTDLKVLWCLQFYNTWQPLMLLDLQPRLRSGKKNKICHPLML